MSLLCPVRAISPETKLALSQHQHSNDIVYLRDGVVVLVKPHLSSAASPSMFSLATLRDQPRSNPLSHPAPDSYSSGSMLNSRPLKLSITQVVQTPLRLRLCVLLIAFYWADLGSVRTDPQPYATMLSGYLKCYLMRAVNVYVSAVRWIDA